MLDAIPFWLVYLLTVALSLVAAETGFRLGMRWRRVHGEEKESVGGAMAAASLALLAFFLAFLVSMTMNRFDDRRALVVDEANAIGTTYLRAGYLAEPHRTTVRAILVEYVAQRLALVDDARRGAALARSRELMDQLWAQAEQLAIERPDSEAISLFVQTTNDTIDLNTKRTVAILTWRLPWTLWLAAYVVAFGTFVLVGFHNGLQGRRSLLPVILVIAIFAAVMNLIVDLDRPYQGLLQVSQEALVELQQQIGKP